jgi:hypothetical protein
MITGVTDRRRICASISTLSPAHRATTLHQLHFNSLSFSTAFAHLHSLSLVTRCSTHIPVFTIPISLNFLYPFPSLTQRHFQDEDHRHPFHSPRCGPRGPGPAPFLQQAPSPGLPDVHRSTRWHRCDAHHRLRKPGPQVPGQGRHFCQHWGGAAAKLRSAVQRVRPVLRHDIRQLLTHSSVAQTRQTVATRH